MVLKYRCLVAWLLCLPFGPAVTHRPDHAQEGCRSVSVDSRATYACVLGTGSPTVVLAAGAGLTSGTWSDIAPKLASFSRVVTFDRAGLGRSDPGPAPRTPTQIARELRSLLRLLEIDGPVVLVGHSMGGVHVLSYSEQYPDDVAGIVLLDTPPRGFEEARLGLLTEAERQSRTESLSRALAQAPEVVRLEREGAASDEQWLFPEIDRRLPVFIVAADAQDFGEVGREEAHRRLWISGARRWMSLSDSSHFILAEGSGHMVHHDRQQLVVDVIRRAASAIR